MRKRKYSGILNESLPPIEHGLLSRNKKAWEKAVIARLDALFQHYDIPKTGDDDDWFWLALKLAFDHVKGFQTEAQRGRRRLDEEKKIPRQQLLEIREKDATLAKMTDVAAAKWLAKNPKRLPPYYRDKKPSDDTIRAEIQATKKERERIRLWQEWEKGAGAQSEQ